jgi:hypothetical protein
MNAGWIVTWIWLFAVILLMILRGVPTPPGRPDHVDRLLILAAPAACMLVAVFCRSWLSVWCIILITIVGSWFAWLDNNRLGLDIAFNGWERHLRWWAQVVAWTLIGGRTAAGVVWFSRDRIAANATSSGMCRVCGYDLRATPERCPECGQLVRKSP